MNKTQLAAAVAERTGATPTEARRQVDAVLGSIVDGVAAGERVSLIGFGTFSSAARPARTARNPQTGAVVEVPAAVVPRFRVGAGFKARVTDAAPSPATQTQVATSAPASKPDKPAKSAKAPEKKKDSKKKSAENKPDKKPKKSDKKSGKKAAKKKGKKK